MAHTGETRLGQAIAPLARDHPDKSGVFALADGRDTGALPARSVALPPLPFAHPATGASFSGTRYESGWFDVNESMVTVTC